MASPSGDTACSSARTPSRTRGVRYVDGRSVAPVDGKTIFRQHQAFGAAIKVEPWDDETAERCLAHAKSIGNAEAVVALEAWVEARNPEDPKGDAGDGLDGLSLVELRARCETAGILPGNKQEKALAKLLRQHAAQATKPEDPKGDAGEGETEAERE